MSGRNMGVMGAAASSLSLLRLFSIVSLLVCSIFSTGATAQGGKPLGLGAVLAGEKNLTTFYNLIQKFPDLLLQLPSLNGITIVAPTNEAFERIPLTSLNAIWKPDDASVVVPILQYHIVQGQFPADAMVPGAPVFAPTLLTSPAWTNLTSGGQLVRADKQPDGFVALTTGSGSRSDLVPLSDGKRDVPFSGGIVQACNNLLIPPTALNATLTSYSDLSFLGALHAAGLYDEFATCGTSGNCTIFAPSVQAFRAVNSTLSSMSRDDLRKVLRYHLVPGQVLTSNLLLNGTVLKAPGEDQQLRVRRAGNYLYLNSAQVVQQDILFANGIVHVLDNVLNAAAVQATPDPTRGTQAPVFRTDSADAAMATVTEASAINALPQPFTTALPCTSNCPAPTTTDGPSGAGASGPSRTSTSAHQTSSSKAFAARCTALPVQPAAAAAALVLGVGGYLGAM
ncbi:fasciclin domain-containing protein [Apiospora arundinis]|uniref:Fasciclin domain-containing protein n=1 Tax=Apiospora arundinis TaxID=335852 RepID=A0ABR2HT07_9PEZI